MFTMLLNQFVDESKEDCMEWMPGKKGQFIVGSYAVKASSDRTSAGNLRINSNHHEFLYRKHGI